MTVLETRVPSRGCSRRGHGTKRKGLFMQAERTRMLVRNCVLVARSPERVRLPLVVLPHPWLEDRLAARRGCFGPGHVPGNKGKKFPATPPSPEDMQDILDVLWNPSMATAKWAAKWGVIGLRNRALVVLLWRSGLRIHEALLLVPADIDFEHCMVTVRRGKGGEHGVCGIDRDALAEINSWLWIRSLLGLGVEEPIFCALEGEALGRPLSQGYVRKCLHAAAREAGVLSRTAPHQLRHALAVELARAGVPVPIISRQLRHKNIATTVTYLAAIAPEEVLLVMSGRKW